MQTLNVSNIQHFSTGDGPGIRTTVFLKGCNLHCPWCHNPETISSEPEELTLGAANKKILYGKLMSVDEIFDEIMEDVDFYRESGGGVTLSGGEPMLQYKGVAALGELLRKNGISLIVDTAASVPWENFRAVLGVVDTFFFDYKSASKDVCERVIGANAERVYDNLCRLSGKGKSVRVRIPVIPEINTSVESCESICLQLRAAGIEYVDLLPFHRLGSGKYDAMGIEYEYKNVEPMGSEDIERIADVYRQYFKVSIEK